MPRRRLNVTFTMAFASVLPLMASTIAHADTFTVNSTADTDGACSTTCTLRQAINAANVSGDPDNTIGFNIPGDGVQVISPATTLPNITHAGTTVDGYLQPGTSPNTSITGSNATIRIRLDGSNLSFSGLTLAASGITVRGLSVTRFTAHGIRAGAAGGGNEAPDATIVGNYLGVTPEGTGAANGRGVAINASPNVTVGGTAPADVNVISGNGSSSTFSGGVAVFNPGTDGSRIIGNLIGVAPDGQPLGNNGSGIAVYQSASDVDVGDGTAQGGNRIGHNDIGVYVDSTASGINLRGNEFFDNSVQAIDLSATNDTDGLTANDSDDEDDGGNGLQNTPVLTSVTLDYGLKVAGSLDIPHTAFSVPRAFRIDVYASAAPCHATGRQGELFVGAKGINLVDGGLVTVETFSIALALPPPLGSYVTATATGPSGTSEFSACVVVQNGDGIFRDGMEE